MRFPEAIAPLVDFFESLEWWRMEPDQSFILTGLGYGLSEHGKQYVVYGCSEGQSARQMELSLVPGSYECVAYDPKLGRYSNRSLEFAAYKKNSKSAESFGVGALCM